MAKHRAGGKITSKHTTVIDSAAEIVDFLKKSPLVAKIVLSIIIPCSRHDATVRVKLRRLEPNVVSITVVQKNTVQEFMFFSPCKITCQEAMTNLARFIRNNDWELRFK